MKRRSKEPGAGGHPDKGKNKYRGPEGRILSNKRYSKGESDKKKRLKRSITGQIR